MAGIRLVSELREAHEITVDGKTFIISKFPATVGRRFALQYVPSGLPKIGDYDQNEALMEEAMQYVAVRTDSSPDGLVLMTPALIDSHVPNGQTLLKLEFAMMQYNFDFFGQGKLSGILERVASQAAALIQKTLTDLSPLLSRKD